MHPSVNVASMSIFIALFLAVTVIGFLAARWRAADLNHLNEWGLGGRSFGTLISWFLLGGDLYTAYTFVAVPASVFIAGAPGFFAVPYTIIAYPIVFVVFPRLWTVAKSKGYITTADFVEGRFQSKPLALAVAFTGILATMPYIALQLVGISVVLTALGFQGTGILADLPLAIAFVILAVYTYSSGLRAPALIALVKDALIYIAVIAIVIVVPMELGGFGKIFALAHAKQVVTHGAFNLNLGPATINSFWSLALGSALALFLYPHSVTGVLSSKSGQVVKRNAALLPAYSFVLGLLALVGFMGVAAGIQIASPKMNVTGIVASNGHWLVQTGNYMIPALVLQSFDPWFQGIVFAGIAIGALVPAAVMSIAAANTFTRNIYKPFFRTGASPAEESQVARLASLVVKFGALAFVFFIPTQSALDYQLLGGVWILQTLPPVIFGLYTRYFNRWALLLGWLTGMVSGTLMVIMATTNYFNKPLTSGLVNALTFYNAKGTPLTFNGYNLTFYAGLLAVALNLVVTVVFTLIFNAARVSNGQDATSPADYVLQREATRGVPAGVALAEE